MTSIKPISNYIILEINVDSEGKHDLGNGKYLQIDTSFDQYQHSVQEGKVVAVPEGFSKWMRTAFGALIETDGLLMPEVGDRVFFHHMVQREKVIPDSLTGLKPSGPGKKLFFCEYSNLFFRKNSDQIECFSRYIVAKKMKKEAVDSVLEVVDFQDFKEQEAEVVAISPLAKEYGLSIGDHVRFSKDSDYWVKVDGEEYYRMEYTEVECIFPKIIKLADV